MKRKRNAIKYFILANKLGKCIQASNMFTKI